MVNLEEADKIGAKVGHCDEASCWIRESLMRVGCFLAGSIGARGIKSKEEGLEQGKSAVGEDGKVLDSRPRTVNVVNEMIMKEIPGTYKCAVVRAFPSLITTSLTGPAADSTRSI